jgi:hypothetical protein
VVLGETEGEPVLTIPHEIAKTSVKSASDFIIVWFILWCLLASVMTSSSLSLPAGEVFVGRLRPL